MLIRAKSATGRQRLTCCLVQKRIYNPVPHANRRVVVIPLLRSIRQDDRGRDDKRGLARVH